MAAADDKVVNVPASTEKSSHTNIANEEVAAVDRSSTPKDSDDDNEFYEDPKAARRLLIKCDVRLIPILGCLYLVSFLDRSNIANARLFGLEKSLHMPSTGFNTCLWIFYLPFVIVEIPSNLFMSLNKIKPNHWLAGAMLILGIVSMCQGLTRSYGGLLACRFIMGIMEAGLPPGAALLIGQYYRRSEFYIRFSYFICFALLGSAFSGLLAYAIEHMNGMHGYEAWRWIFILEGLFTFAFGLAAWFIIPAFPQEAAFLSDDERAMLLARLRHDRGRERVDFKGINWLKLLTDWKIWSFTLIYFCADMGAASISSFTPTILAQLGWSASRAQVMSIPIWMVGIVVTLSTSYASGKLSLRWPFVLTGAIFSLIGWCIQYTQVQPPAVRYFALYIIAFGSFMQFPILIGWLNSNLRGRPQQAVASAVQLGMGNCANFVASNVFITKQAPKYPTGFATGVGFATLATVIYEATKEDVDDAVAAAKAAFPAWASLSPYERGRYLVRLADLIVEANADLAHLEAESMGRPVSTYFDATTGAKYFRYFSEAAYPQGGSSLNTPGFVNITLKQPVGVVAAIIPWNAPLIFFCKKLAPALAAGNAVVLKSSEKAPLTSLYVAMLAQKAGFPPGVLNVLSGHGPVSGAALASHMDVRALTFTGSNRTGKLIAKMAADSNMKNLIFELGGKSPAIIFDDADIDAAVRETQFSIQLISGQTCMANSRIYVQRTIAESFIEKFKVAFTSARLGDPTDPQVNHGPQADKIQHATVLRYIELGKETGKLVTDEQSASGLYINPTIFRDVPEDARIMKEEIFGPVVIINTFDTEAEAVANANNTEHGLYASVYTKDLDRAMRVASRLEAGTVGVNCTSPTKGDDMPFGGQKGSGVQRESYIHSMETFMETKSVLIKVAGL
ncbi:aldehyde dehydrogenase family domain-containing protein [Trichoderma velutinum]